MDVFQPPTAQPKGKGRSKSFVADALYDYEGATKLDQLKVLYSQWFKCTRCALSQFRTGDDIVFGSGNPNAHCLIIGEAPGEQEERDLEPFVGPSGQLLNQLLAYSSADPTIHDLLKWYGKVPHSSGNTKKFHDTIFEWRDKEFFFSNVIACRPPENRTPTVEEMRICWERVWNMIYIIDPLLIIAVGKQAAGVLMRKPGFGILSERGKLFDARHVGKSGTDVIYPVMPVLHPSYLLRVADFKVKGGDWDKTRADWMNAMRTVDSLRNKFFGTPVPQRGF